VPLVLLALVLLALVLARWMVEIVAESAAFQRSESREGVP
jgi:hypothetical protein